MLAGLQCSPGSSLRRRSGRPLNTPSLGLIRFVSIQDVPSRKQRPLLDRLGTFFLGLLVPAVLAVHGVRLITAQSGQLYARASSYRVEGFDATLGGILQCSLAASLLAAFCLARRRSFVPAAYLIGVPAGLSALGASVWLYIRSP